MQRADGKPVLFVIGASGSGKSSLVRAGIVPALMEPRDASRIDVWRHVVIEPVPDTLGLLAIRLYNDPGTLPELAGIYPEATDWLELAHDKPRLAAKAVAEALQRAAADRQQAVQAGRPFTARLLIVVDQLEALFGTEDQTRVADLLKSLVATERVWLVLTMRSDRYPDLQQNRILLDLKTGGSTFDLPPPGPAEIADIVRGPARMAGLELEEKNEKEGDETKCRSLADELIQATPGSDALPLLQMTLARLFEQRQGTTLTLTGGRCHGWGRGCYCRPC